MDDPSTDALRKLAPSWTLAGDEQLFSILQNTHQRLVSKCQEANSQLEQMATALNDASISLQNVNNQFMALSSSQFIERRVYDDDDVASDVPAVKEQPKPEVRDELTSLKRSISVLENAHEMITILHDSDTESDTDDEMPARMVLKPKDMYADRPLPYIIGSQAWKNKWHAGLLLEDSDSDSTASKVEHDSDQYSQSEPEDTHTDKLPVPIHTQTTVSETSSEPPSEQGSVPKPTPSDVASEIARRLGAREPAKILEREPENEELPKPTVRKIYRPQDPVSSTIFPDEPPPLSEQSDSESDIFADLHRAQPYARTEPYESAGAAHDLFGADQQDSDDGDIFSDFANKPTNAAANPASLFDSGPAPNMFVKHTDNRRNHVPDDNHRRHARDSAGDDSKVYEERGIGDDLRGRRDEPERGVKKPIGGISLFGNKGTESIGAAILNRNQRKPSTSDDESESDSRSESQSNQQTRKEKDIFDDLFARSESKKVTNEKDFSKDLKTEIKKKVEVKEKKEEKPKVDLFSDNLFDDIDDIFSTNVVKMPAKDAAKTKSIFEDNDDLFSEIAAPKPVKIEVATSSSNKKSLFDSDDELFSENKPVDKPKETPKPVAMNKPKIAERKINETSNVNKEISKSIFDDDEDELFGDSKTVEVSKVQNSPVSIGKPSNFGKENNAPKNTFKSPSLFDDDDDDEIDIFAEPVKTSNVQNIVTTPIKETRFPTQSDEQIHTKLPSNTDEEIPTIPNSQTEVKMIEENIDSSSVIKTVESKDIIVQNEINKNFSKTTVDKVVNTSEIGKSLDNEDSVLPVSKNVDSKNKIVETNAAKIFDHIRNMERNSTDANDDFSDQDFDELPPKEECNKPVIDNSNIVTDKHNIFDKVTLEEDIDELFVATQQRTDNSKPIFNTEPDFTEAITKKTEHDNKKEEITPKNIGADIFSNILTEPPVFEKPKEPKKSKNVNALFDDDSDDESLFFKKNDTIFVENPQEFTPTQDRIFGLFTDEPPDDGFSKISDEFDDDMFSTLPKPKIPQNEYPPIPDTLHFEEDIPEIEKSDQVEEISSVLPKEEVKTAPEVTKESNLDKEEDIFTVTTTETVVEGPKSTKGLSVHEQLFKVPSTNESKPPSKKNLDKSSDEENLFGTVTSKPSSSKQEIAPPNNITPIESKPALKEKSSLDMLSDDEVLFSSARTLDKNDSFETVKEKPVTEDKKLISKDEPNLDMLSNDENLKLNTMETSKPNNKNVQDKLTLKALTDEENLFSSKPQKPTLKDKPSRDLLDEENLFGSGPKLEKPPSLTSTKLEKPIPASKKPTLQDKSTADSFSDDENLFASVSKLEKSTSSVQDKTVSENKRLESVSKSSDDELFTSLKKTEKPLATESKLLQQDSKSDEDLFKIPAKSEFLSKPSETKLEKSEKKVGKLKVGLNINVNALLPGASPKKMKPNDQPDGQNQSAVESQKPEPNIHTEVRKSEPETQSQNTDSKLQKAVSFDGKPESDVLDNKLSKERAKIQVKRRPSTRRARREAVRKSGIDFGEDSTDNSSSIDDPPRKQTNISNENPKPNEDIQNILPDKSDVQDKDDTTVQAKIDAISVEKQPTIEPERQAEVVEKPSYSRNVKSKVVYILNDEDIFNTGPVDNINKNISKNVDSNVGVSTLGKVYDKDAENKSKTDAKSSLFGEETDDEVFKPKAVVKKSTIFDSDSEEDLFGTTSKEEERKVEKVEVKREIKREVVKGPLFGDEDEDDDLFGVKTKKIVDHSTQPTRSTIKETPKTAEPVFEDPLSMFGDDD